MSSLSPPSDHYKILGVAKDASLSEIRRAHHKLVLKCHPDKIRDATLKAVKQNEFQKVQEAYEILSDERRRQAYDDSVQKYELRKQMSNGNPTARSNPFEYEIKTTTPQSGTYRSRVKVYTYQASPAEYFGEVKITTSSKKQSASAPDKKQSSKDYVKWEAPNKKESSKRKQKDKERELRHERKKAKERKEKERKRSTDDKRTKKANTPVEEIPENEPQFQRAAEKKSSKIYMEEPAKVPEETTTRATAAVDAAPGESAHVETSTSRSPKEKSMNEKWIGHEDFAGAYLEASRQKASAPEGSKVTVPEVPNAPTPSMRRADSLATPSVPNYNNSRYMKVPDSHLSDDDSAQRPARHREKKASDLTGATGKKSKVRKSPKVSTSKSSREPPKTPPSGRKPTLQNYSSAPPLVREHSSHIQAQDASHLPESTPLARSQTYSESRSRHRRHEVISTPGSGEKNPSSRHAPSTPSYTVENGRIFGANARTSFSRAPNMTDFNAPSRSVGSPFFTPDPSALLHTVHPQASPRNTGANMVSLGNVRYSRIYEPENVVFTSVSTTYFSSQEYERAGYYSQRNRREDGLYVS